MPRRELSFGFMAFASLTIGENIELVPNSWILVSAPSVAPLGASQRGRSQGHKLRLAEAVDAFGGASACEAAFVRSTRRPMERRHWT
jgi:hypothetical protein